MRGRIYLKLIFLCFIVELLKLNDVNVCGFLDFYRFVGMYVILWIFYFV